MKREMKREIKKLVMATIGILWTFLFAGIWTQAEEITIRPTVLDCFKEDSTAVATYHVTIPAEKEEIVVPVEITQRGRTCFEFSVADTGWNRWESFGLYNDAACTDALDEGYSHSPNIWLERGIYYLKIKKYGYEDSFYNETTREWEYIKLAADITVRAFSYSGEDATLTNGMWITASYNTENGREPVYYKLTVKKRGYIRLELEGDLNYTLCNKKKKPLESVYGHIYSSNEKVCDCIAVEKGTYYIEVSNGSGVYRLRYTFKSDPNKKNYTKNKAISLKKNKTVYNVVYTKDKEKTYTRWYRIKVPAKKRLVFTVNQGIGSYRGGTLMISPSIYDSKGKGIFVFYDKGSYYTSKKIPAGVYYIRMGVDWNFKEKKRTMGSYFSLSWK